MFSHFLLAFQVESQSTANIHMLLSFIFLILYSYLKNLKKIKRVVDILIFYLNRNNLWVLCKNRSDL